jgi:hypothetical protein
MSDNNVTLKKKTVFSGTHMQLSAPCPTAKGKFSSLLLDFSNNGSPRLIVRTGDPADQGNDYGRIQAALNPQIFNILILLVKKAIQSPKADKWKIECHNYDRVDGQRAQELSHISDVWVGRDDEGVIFISVLAKNAANRPVIKFNFAPKDSRYHPIFHGNASAFSKSEMSQLVAESFILSWEHMASMVMVENYVPPPAPDFSKGKGGGGYGGNKQYGGGNSYGNQASGRGYTQKPAADDISSSEDIPF